MSLTNSHVSAALPKMSDSDPEKGKIDRQIMKIHAACGVSTSRGYCTEPWKQSGDSVQGFAISVQKNLHPKPYGQLQAILQATEPPGALMPLSWNSINQFRGTTKGEVDKEPSA
jgi:hypothetical protein